MITFDTIDVIMPSLDAPKIRSWIDGVVCSRGKRVGELHYHFCSDEALLEINRERLGHDFYTDIITFPLGDCEEYVSSDFCISVDRVSDNATAMGRPFVEELCRVVIHGVLHLVGFDDLTDEEEQRMHEKEDECLGLLYKQLKYN